MKAIITSAFILSSAAAFAQGLVLFNNTPSTLVTYGIQTPISGQAGSWYFGLLTSPSGSGPFTFTGNYATNAPTAPGRFLGGTQTVNGWSPGATMFYEVAGWSGTLGPTFQPGWLVGNFGGRSGLFGVSDIGSGTAGGGNPPAPAFPLFGGTGISSGFLLFPTPEPSTATIIAVGAIVLTFFRRKVKPKN